MERQSGEFQVRTRVLFDPIDEHAYVLLFSFFQGRFVLADVAESNDDWFGAEKQAAVELARNFIFAAKAGKEDALSRLVSPGIPISSFVTDSCWQQFFHDTEEPRVNTVALKSYKGLKIEVDLNLSPAAGFGFHDIGQAYFVVDRVDGEYKIVGADPRGDYNNFWHPDEVCRDKSVLTKTEDPEIESRTLARFRLKSE